MDRLMDYIKAYDLLKRYGIAASEGKYVSNAGEAISFAASGPIALKGISQKALHKTKSGLVALDLSTPPEIKKAFLSITRTASKFRPYKILAQRLFPPSRNNMEIIVGGRQDAQFGKLLLIGLGGIYVEIFKDFSVRLCPVSRHDAESMLDDLRSKAMIAKAQQQREMLVGILMKVSKLLEENAVKELDLNPIITNGARYCAVDIRILI